MCVCVSNQLPLLGFCIHTVLPTVFGVIHCLSTSRGNYFVYLVDVHVLQKPFYYRTLVSDSNDSNYSECPNRK